MADRAGHPASGPGITRAGFTLIELLVVAVIISILTSIALTNFHSIRVKAHLKSVVADARILYTGFQEFHALNYMYPNATSPPNFNTATFEPMRSMGVYQGNMQDRLLNRQADAYDSPDDIAPNQEFWVQFTLRIDPTYQIVCASSDNAPLSGGSWLEGVYVYQNGALVEGPGT